LAARDVSATCHEHGLVDKTMSLIPELEASSCDHREGPPEMAPPTEGNVYNPIPPGGADLFMAPPPLLHDGSISCHSWATTAAPGSMVSRHSWASSAAPGHLGHDASASASLAPEAYSDGMAPLFMDRNGEKFDLAQAMRSNNSQQLFRPVGKQFEEQVLSLCQEVANVLREFSFCLEVSVQMSGLSGCDDICMIFATIAGESQYENYRKLIHTAQEGIYSRTSRGSGVCLLGYKTGAFTETQQGFKAWLAGVLPVRSACRKLFHTGHCRQKAKCPFMHPTDMMSLQVVIVAAESM